MLLKAPQGTPQERIICPQMSTNMFSKRSRPQQVTVRWCKGELKSGQHCESCFGEGDLAKSQGATLRMKGHTKVAKPH